MTSFAIYDFEMDFVVTKRGQRALIFQGRSFWLNREYQNGHKRWVCRSRLCQGSLVTNSEENVVLKEQDHSCAPDDAKIAIEKMKQDGLKRCHTELTPIPKIHKEIFSPAFDQGLDLVVKVPNLSSIKTAMYCRRKKALGDNSSSSTSIMDVVLARKFTDGFLLADTKLAGDRILIFGSEKAIKCFENAEEVFGDGTFKSCPKQFAQVYSLHVDIGSNQDHTAIVPCIYALLPNKTQATYENFFNILKQKVPLWSPKKFKVDFEVAVICAIASCLPSVEIKGCNFHFNQSLLRKVQSLGLVTEYRENVEIKSFIRQCSALAHIPPDSLDEGWLAIMENAPSTHAIRKFCDYMVEQWLENPTVGLMWSCYGERHRTTNALEGWHSKVNKTFGKSHPNIFEVILRLKEDAAYYDLVRAKAELNIPTQKRLKRYRSTDEAIKKSVEEYASGKITILACIKKLGYHMKF